MPSSMPRIRLVTAVVVSLCAAAAHAWPGSERNLWSVNGYGTIGIVHSSEDRADYLPDALRAEGPGRSGHLTPDLDSRLAAQLSVHPRANLTAVVQAVLEQDFDGEYRPTIEWANVRYELSPAWSVRVGRIEVDSFLVADHRKVGFAIPWVRPPPEVYGGIPVTRNDGLDLTYRVDIGPLTYRASASIGRNDEYDGADAEGGTLANTLEWNDFTFRATFAHVELDLEEMAPLFDGIAQLGPEGAAVARRYNPADHPLQLIAFGARYAPGSQFLMAEWTRTRTDAIFGGSTGWYLSGGRRFGAVTPFVTFARADRQDERSVKGLTVTAYPPELAPVAAGFNQALDGIRNGGAVQDTWTLGMRWDVAAAVDLKVQYDRVDVDDGSRGTFGNEVPGYRSSGADLFSLALDFVF